MGSCVCINDKRFSFNNNSNKIQNISKLLKINKSSKQSNNAIKINPNYFQKISKKNWVRILNFLKYKELREASKVNRVMNSISGSQKVLWKFFENKSHSRNIYKRATCSSIKNNFSKTVTEITNISNYKLAISFEALNSEDKDSKSNQDLPIDKKPTYEFVKRSFASDMDKRVISKKRNSDGKEMANKIKLLTIHNNTNFSKISDSQTPSFGNESSLQSSIEKSETQKNIYFRSFGSHNTKKSKFVVNHPNDSLNPKDFFSNQFIEALPSIEENQLLSMVFPE